MLRTIYSGCPDKQFTFFYRNLSLYIDICFEEKQQSSSLCTWNTKLYMYCPEICQFHEVSSKGFTKYLCRSLALRSIALCAPLWQQCELPWWDFGLPKGKSEVQFLFIYSMPSTTLGVVGIRYIFDEGGQNRTVYSFCSNPLPATLRWAWLWQKVVRLVPSLLLLKRRKSF